MSSTKNYDLSFIRTFLESNPHAYKELGVWKQGRPKGSKNKVETITEVTPEDIKELGGIKLTAKQQKELVKKKRAPRQMSDEQKAQMLENLRLGREKQKALREASKQVEKVVLKKAPVTKPDAIPVVQKIRKQRIPKQVPLKSDTDEDESESDLDTTTGTETEPEVRKTRKRFQKRKELIEQIDQEISKLPVTTKPLDKYGLQLSRRW